MKIPYGFGVLSHPWVWHCDAFLTGKWRMAYGDTENYITLKLYDDVANPTRVHINRLEEQSKKADDVYGYGYYDNNGRYGYNNGYNNGGYYDEDDAKDNRKNDPYSEFF